MVNDTKCTGCENEIKPAAVGKNTHDAFVTLDAVNNGKKKLVAGGIGTQSKPIVLPENETLGDVNDCMIGETSNTETSTSLKAITRSVIAGSTSLMFHLKPFAGLNELSDGWISSL